MFPERDKEISFALGIGPYLEVVSLPEFLFHEPIGYECDEERQEEVEKGHGEEEAGEVSAGRVDRGVRTISQGRLITVCAGQSNVGNCSHQASAQSVVAPGSQVNSP